MRVLRATEGEVTILSPQGPLVFGEVEESLSEQLESLLEEGAVRVVLDLSQVPHMDSTVLGRLVHARTRFRAQGGDLRLLKPGRRVLDLLEITRLGQVFLILQEREAALAEWDPL